MHLQQQYPTVGRLLHSVGLLQDILMGRIERKIEDWLCSSLLYHQYHDTTSARARQINVNQIARVSKLAARRGAGSVLIEISRVTLSASCPRY